MEYNFMPPDTANVSSGLPEDLKGLQGFGDVDGETICRSTEFIVRHVLAPAVEATIFAYMKNCTLRSERIISDQWYLCTPEHDFNCADIYKYTSQCKTIRDSCGYSSTTARPGTMDRLMGDTKGVLLLVGLVLIGILLGVASTIAVCLMCPQTHRWANSKLRNTAESEKKARASVISDYYTAIDDRHNNVTLQLRPMKTASVSSVNSDTCQQLHPPSPRDFEDSTYIDSDSHSSARAVRTQHPENQPSASQEPPYGAGETYEPLTRQKPDNQSHNYAHIDQKSPSSPDNEHSYFVLEKTT